MSSAADVSAVSRIFGARPRRTANEREAAHSLPAVASTAVWTLLVVSGLVVWLVVYGALLSGIQQRRTNTVLYSQLRESLSEATVPVGGLIAPGTPIALLDAPGAGIGTEVLVEGTSSEDLRAGPGHRRDTPLPGQAGASVIYGRAATFGGPFGKIDQLLPHDRITVTTGQGTFSYYVERVRHAGDPLPAQLTSGGSRLTLVTATGSPAPSKVVYVDALLKGQTVPAPSGRLRSVPPSEKAMQGDPSVWVQLVLWLQALVIVGVGAAWARTRWGSWQAWLVSVPAVLAVLWGTSGVALALLPNLV